MPEQDFAAALGRVPSGIFILTVAHDGQETGMLVSWVVQAGFEPPMVSVAVKSERYVCQWLTNKASFVLNIVPSEGKALLGHFGRGFEPGEPAFEGLEIIRTANDLPVLTTALGHLECEPGEFIDSGDHRIFLCKIVGGRLASQQQPMVHIRRNGLQY